jgi:CRISPR-associated protein Cas2
MQHFLVAYDIEDDTTRRQVGELLEEYGLRVQRSLFEIRIKNPKELQRLKADLRRLIDPAADSLRFYAQCVQCLGKAEELGDFPGPFQENSVYFF